MVAFRTPAMTRSGGATLFPMVASEWLAFLATMPESTRSIAERFPPNRLYRLKATGSRVTIHSYSDDGTVTVACTGNYNAVMFDRVVFGIDPADLEWCGMPGPHEKLGTVLQSDEEIAEYIAHAQETAARAKVERENDADGE